MSESLLVRPVILSGGAGTRLWPISTGDVPKQFAPLIGDRSLFSQTLSRIAGVAGISAPIVVTGVDHEEHVRSAAADSDVDLERVIVEPVGRNTAPAIVAAALLSDPSDILVVLPSDHLVADESGFRRAVADAVKEAGEGMIVTFGVVPTRPETGYGYIESGGSVGAARKVVSFKEKPDLAGAESMVADGKHSWNSGMFVFSAGAILGEARAHCPEIVSGVSSALGADGVLGPEFADVEKISIDHAVMEKTGRAVVIPIDVGWDDIGSFGALWSVLDRDEFENAASGDVVLDRTSGSLVLSTSRKVVVSGVEDLVVVETPDAVLVVPRRDSQLVGELSRTVDPD